MYSISSGVDITDIYIFQKPGDANKSILVFNVNPVAPTFADSFASEAVYELKVDTNGDAVAKIAYRFTFLPKQDGVQAMMVRRASGEQARGAGKEGEILFQDVPMAFREEFRSVESGEYRFFVGMRSDPFFFDLGGFKDGLKFTTGADTFLEKKAADRRYHRQPGVLTNEAVTEDKVGPYQDLLAAFPYLGPPHPTV